MHILLDVFNDVTWYMMRGGLLLAFPYSAFVSSADALKTNRTALIVALALQTPSV